MQRFPVQRALVLASQRAILMLLAVNWIVNLEEKSQEKRPVNLPG